MTGRFALPPAIASTRARWESPEFLEELTTWCADALGEPVRLENVKQRVWSTVWRVTAGDRLFYAKQNCPANHFEAALVERLHALAPDHVVPVTAVDPGRGFLITPDQGDVLGFDDDSLETWAAIVGHAAELQRMVLSHTDELVASGVEALLPADSEELVVERTAALHALPADHPGHLGADVVARIEAGRPDLRRSVEVVTSLGLPLALNHNDLHGNNVFVRDDGSMTFFDFGDAMMTDPTGVLLVPLGMLADQLDCGPADPRLWRVAQAWVDVWSDVVPASALRASLPDAMRLARLARHESWVRVTPGMTAEESDQWARAGSEWLGEVPEPPPLQHPAPRE